MAKSKTRVLNDANVIEALRCQLLALSVIDDNEVVTKYKKVPEGIEVSIVKED